MTQTVDRKARSEVRLGKQGRVVIPAEMREELGWKPGDTLIALVEDGHLVLMTRQQIWERIWAMFSHIPPEVSLVDELIAERREEFRKEEEEMREFEKGSANG